jgi:hypothetical protein
MFSFIHIGKTGGSTVHSCLKSALGEAYNRCHMCKNYNDREKYIIWIRNPISRFVSAFNQSYLLVTEEIDNGKKYTMQNCIVPERMEHTKKKYGFAFTKEYDSLVKSFSSANELAESLTSSDVNLRKRAVKLMRSKEGHLFKGIGWYLNDGNFIKNRRSRIIFIGRTEHMTDDIEALSKKIGVPLKSDLKIRVNVFSDKSAKYLSDLAIKNIINWYKNTDYASLKTMLDFGFIDDETYNSYHTYCN